MQFLRFVGLRSQRANETGVIALGAILLFLPATQLLAQRNRIAGAVDPRNRVALLGHVHPMASSENDQGLTDTALTLKSVTLTLKPSADQQTALEKLLADQQDPASPDYHRWLTPEEYGDRFGASAEDIAKITGWLEQQGFAITSVARARNAISFSGTAGQIDNAFQTEIRNYNVRGELHFANATEPTIPAAFNGIVRTVRGLHNFRMKPAIRKPMAGTTPATTALKPNYTSSRGNHYLSPDDVATIYNIAPLYNAGINGTGQKVVVAGQTQVNLSDIQTFRSSYGLPASDPQLLLVPGTRDPGVSDDDLPEADLDIEWAGAVARNANIIYVYSYDVMDAVQYAIDQNLAPVITVSYGLCEPLNALSDALTYQSWARQANAQGITWFAASGDSGGADCATSNTSGGGLAVDLPAAVPEVTGVGGTTLNEGSGSYWASSNSSSQSSAQSYIPEVVWNDTIADGAPSAGGGGASKYFGKPSWQTGAGVPSDKARDVPDVAMAASADHDGYLVYSSGSVVVYGGTSVGTPVVAGIASLINQQLVASGAQSSPGMGNVNPKLYSLAQTNPQAFHDITSGDNIVTVTCRGRNCTGGSFGYSAGPGYDQATGLGSLDAYNLVTAWAGAVSSVSRGSVNLRLEATLTTMPTSGSTNLTATVQSVNGGTPTGSVTFYLNSVALGTSDLSGSGGVATATLPLTGAQLPIGAASITAQYSGDSSFNTATGSVTVTVTGASSGPPSITGTANGASFRQAYAPGMVLSLFGSNLAPSTWQAASLPLPAQLAGVSVTVNGVNAPLYYASPTQLNVQIPYEATPNGAANVVVNNNGQTASTSFLVAARAPGIFTNGSGFTVPTTTAARGQVIAVYVTGDGAVSPTIPTGAGPAPDTPTPNLPKPTANVSVSVGGANATVQFAGIPPGLAGITQINFVVPTTTALGPQQVVVAVGNVSSAPATLTVTQ